jgi:hypothetical protein
VREHNHVLERNPVTLRDLPNELSHIFDHVSQISRGAAFTRRATVTARIPGKDGDIVQA